jgi:integrase/recombinase XerD
MSVWPDEDGSVIARYLRKLRLRSRNGRTYYRQILCSFQDVARQHQDTPGHVGRDVVEAWLRGWAGQWQRSTLLHRANILNRFLDHLVREDMIASNPIAGLRDQYSVKQTKPILQALMAKDPDRALEAIRRKPPFGSVLGDLMRNHIALCAAEATATRCRQSGSSGSTASSRNIRNLPVSPFP